MKPEIQVKYVSLARIAADLGRCQRTVMRWIACGFLPEYELCRMGGPRARVVVKVRTKSAEDSPSEISPAARRRCGGLPQSREHVG